jgi:hypothetical protein
MKTRERIVIYGLLVVLLAVNASHLMDGTTRPAYAGPLPGADDLSAEALILSGTGDDEDVVLRNRGSRLAWGDAAHERAHSVAYVFIGKVLNQLMQSEQYTDDRSRLLSELNETEEDYRTQLEEVSERIKEHEPESEEAKRIYAEGNEIYQQYMAWQKNAVARRGQLDAEHLEGAYRELIEAVEVVADGKGIDTVYRFIPTSEEFNAENPEQAMTAIRLRTALRYPEDLDITEDVLEELSLDTE